MLIKHDIFHPYRAINADTYNKFVKKRVRTLNIFK